MKEWWDDELYIVRAKGSPFTCSYIGPDKPNADKMTTVRNGGTSDPRSLISVPGEAGLDGR